MKTITNNLGLIFVVVASLLIVAAFWYAHQASSRADDGVELSAHIKGNPDATVKLVEYSDFQCPACKAAEPAIEEALSRFGDQISFEYRHFPLLTIHRHALAASVAAEAAGQQGKFWEMHDKLFAEQEVWGASANPTVYFLQYANDLGLDAAQFKRQLASGKIENAIRDSFNDAREQGFTGTPTFVLDGQRMVFDSYEEFFGQIAAAVGGDTNETEPIIEDVTATTTPTSTEPSAQ